MLRSGRNANDAVCLRRVRKLELVHENVASVFFFVVCVLSDLLSGWDSRDIRTEHQIQYDDILVLI